MLAWVDKHVTPRSHEDPGLKHAVAELRSRLEYLNEVGLGYLSSDRATRTPFGWGDRARQPDYLLGGLL